MVDEEQKVHNYGYHLYELVVGSYPPVWHCLHLEHVLALEYVLDYMEVVLDSYYVMEVDKEDELHLN